MKNLYFYDTPVGRIRIAEEEGAVTNLFFESEKELTGIKLNETPVLRETYRQLLEYFDKTRKVFDIPIKLEGTEFQMRDWAELLKIPYGETKSYGEIAKALGIPKGSRAIGLANNRNPVSIIVPCHRVIGYDGKLVGFGGGLHIKEALLRLEGAIL